VVIDMQAGEEMRDHQVRERAVLQVVSGRVSVSSDGQETECEPGTLATFAPSERHAVRALDDSRLLLLLAPWPAEGHYQTGEDADPERLPEHAAAPPLA
jgi:quercetin dioxygenase-like cupin family protein